MFCPIILIGQNLIPNPSFEITKQPKTTPLYLPADWTNANTGSPDYITSLHTMVWGMPSNDLGYQQARTGDAYMGVLIYGLSGINRDPRREYIQIQFRDTLEKDSSYCLQFYLSLADSMQYASRKMMGVHFSDIAISSTNKFALPYTPQIIVSDTDYISDKTNWVEYNFEYKANGGERHITIGNFNDTTQIDTTYVGGGSKFFYEGTYYYIDDIYLGHCDSIPNDTLTSIAENQLFSVLKAYPNPVEEHFFLENNSKEGLQFQLYNLLGQAMDVSPNQNGKRYEFAIGHLPKGIYLLRVNAQREMATIKLIKK